LSHLLSYLPFLDYSPREKAGLARAGSFRREGWGFFAEQSTKPQTIGFGLADSPVGLLAWIYEKLVHWTDDYKWDDDEGYIPKKKSFSLTDPYSDTIIML